MDLIAGPKCFYRGRFIPEGTRFSAPRQYGRPLVAMKRARPAPETAPRTYSTRAVPAAATERVVMTPAPVDDDLKALRSQYRAEFGRPPHYTWSADALREKLSFS